MTPVRRLLAVVPLALSCLLTTGCAKKKVADAGDIDQGRVANGVYTNDTFRFQVTLPEGWHVMSQAELDQTMKAGGDMIEGQNENMKGALKAAQKKTKTLMGVMKLPPGSPTTDNPNLLVLGEVIGHMPGVKTGDDYLFHVKKSLKTAGFDTQTTDESPVQMAGRTFGAMGNKLTLGPGMTVHQRMYAAVDGDLVLVLNLTAQDEDGLAELQKILDTMKSTSPPAQ